MMNTSLSFFPNGFVIITVCLATAISSFASATTRATVGFFNRNAAFDRCYEFDDEGVMIAAVNSNLYNNGMGCGWMLLVTCADGGLGICSAFNNQVVVKITRYYSDYPNAYPILLSSDAYNTIVNPRFGEVIDITYQIYTKENYTLDTLKQGEVLDLPGQQQLISANNLFALGSYQSNWNNWTYMAIFLKNGNPHPVWVYKRNHTTSSLQDHIFEDFIKSIDMDGINMTVTLLDSGNLVVRETNSDGSFGRTLWQSFDYPTDTLLPGMKLGIDRKTGQNWKLRSWLGVDRPDEGPFSLEWDTKGRKLVYRNWGVIYWTSGTLQDTQNFEFLHVNDSNIYFMNRGNGDEEYFTFSHINVKGVGKFITIPKLVLNYTGRISMEKSSNLVVLEEGFCSGYSELRGCYLREQPTCRPRLRNFELRSGTFRNAQSETDNGFYGPDRNFARIDCQEKCWKNCSCLGYSFTLNSSYCQFWAGKNLSFFQDNVGASRPLYVLNAELSDHSRKWLWIFVPTTVCVITVLIGIAYYVLRKRRQGKEKELLELMTLNGYTEAMVVVNNGKKVQEVEDFSYSSIQAATKCFSSENKLGEGGFGPVYKGKLPDGQEIAVKKLSKRSGQGLVEFKTELILIGKLQHNNLVRLFGYCVHKKEKMLVYEYMPNKSLDFFLFDEANKHQLPWVRRFNIIIGVAHGLFYLHQHSRVRIVHRDLKASNILLDGNMNPKISDFGLARIFKPDSCSKNTVKIAGTRGYMAPEYLKEGTFSDKSDVFSFGVLVLEIVSGRKTNSFYDAEHPMNLITHAWELWYGGAASDFMDQALVDSCTAPEQLTRCIQIGLLCVQHHASHRPTMSTVVSMLSSPEVALQPPNQPSFPIGNHVVEDIPEDVNDITFSEFTGR